MSRARVDRSGSSSVVVSLLVLGGLVACADAPAGPTPGRPVVEGEPVLELVRTQVGFGPRVPGTEAHARQLAWMIARLDSLASDVVADTFPWVTTTGDSLVLTNVLARFRPEETRRILLLAHWDTRPTSDEAADPMDRSLPLPGANDGASGTAVLLHLAALLAAAPPPLGVDVLLVDGEDYGPTTDDMFLGARRYAAHVAGAEERGEPRPIYGVLLDLVGDADAQFPVEGYSARYAPIVVRKIRDAAERLGLSDFFPSRVGESLGDDHLPLIEAGLPTANVIDFTYGPGNAYWHTQEDTVDKLSAVTLGMVGEVVAELVYSGG